MLAPSVDAERLSTMADRLVRVVEASQSADRPRVGVRAGVAACPENGHDAAELIDAAERAASDASAAGRPVEIAVAGASPPPEEANGTYQTLQ